VAWQTSDRSAQLPANWARIRAAVLKRDGYWCVASRNATAGQGERCLMRH
jgi:hypothetical protein